MQKCRRHFYRNRLGKLTHGGDMTKNEFDLQMIRLEEVYNSKYSSKYPKERKDIFWDRFHKIGNDSFTHTVSDFIANSERAPMAKDFESALSCELGEIRARERKEWEKEKREKKLCRKCGGTGEFSEYEGGSYDRTVKSAWFRIVRKHCDCIDGKNLEQTHIFGEEPWKKRVNRI